MNSAGVPCTLMRGGTSKGAFFLASDLPVDPGERDDLLLRIMGSPDARQIDGVGGGHPLTSKVAVVSPSSTSDADVDYLFLQVSVDQATVSDRQNCGNMLAGVAPFALEQDLIRADGDCCEVGIRMVNTNSLATATIEVVDGQPDYDGDTMIAGVPFPAAEVRLDFVGTEGGSCGSLLPTGNHRDRVAGVEATLIDNGMPVVCMLASDLGITGTETCAELEANRELRTKLEEIRALAGEMMNLGDVSESTVPKMTMVSEPTAGGTFSTRTFIPHRCHEAIGVLGAVSVATAALLPDSSIAGVAKLDPPTVAIEHPTGTFEAVVDVSIDALGDPQVHRSGIIRTARKLMQGTVFPRGS